ncbi:hypothetical protein [Ruegeria sp. HKCCD8929]|uniref:hypothetical protein n=1 Tax=Ruegeria sp. HKCCD8929 TaxID=2683006 RepID=UPI0014881619|nr:hypothetical protein [Ruegeria sp. HKCCD8929]
MQVTVKLIPALMSATLILSACSGGTSQTSANVLGLQSISGVQRAALAAPSEKELAMNCAQIEAELARHYARMEEINRAERARERQTNLTGGLVDAGLSVLGAGAIANAGSAQGIRNVGTATNLVGTAAQSATRGSGPNAQTYNEALAISERSAVLERVKLDKGC